MSSLDKVIWMIGTNKGKTGTEIAKLCNDKQQNISGYIHGKRHCHFFSKTKIGIKVTWELSQKGQFYFDRLQYEYLYDVETDTRLQYADSKSGAPR